MNIPNWPQNLWDDISSDLPFWTKNEEEQPSVLYLPNLDSVLSSALNDRQQKVIRMRYEQGLTYREIGQVFGVGVECVRKIKVTALRNLREPKYFLRLWGVPKIEVKRLQGEIKELTRQKEDLEERIQILSDQINAEEAQRIKEQMKMPLGTLIRDLGFTVRAQNCLIAHGINTLSELLSYTKSDLWRIRNLGKRSVADIERTLNACGYELRREKQI